MSNSKKNNKQTVAKSSRRKALKSLAVGGAVVGASQALPAKWVNPVINSIVLPSHAQTSIGSVIYAGAVNIASIDSSNTNPTMIAKQSGINHQLLEFLVPSAQASHARTGWCNNLQPQLVFEVHDASDTVTICASWQGADDDGSLIDQATTTIFGKNITDFQLTGGDDGVDDGGGISITNCVLSDDFNTITGTSTANGDDDDSTCTGNFTLTRTEDVFACSPNTDDDGGAGAGVLSGHKHS